MLWTFRCGRACIVRQIYDFCGGVKCRRATRACCVLSVKLHPADPLQRGVTPSVRAAGRTSPMRAPTPSKQYSHAEEGTTGQRSTSFSYSGKTRSGENMGKRWKPTRLTDTRRYGTAEVLGWRGRGNLEEGSRNAWDAIPCSRHVCRVAWRVPRHFVSAVSLTTADGR